MMTPPPLGVGEFHAELDPDEVCVCICVFMWVYYVSFTYPGAHIHTHIHTHSHTCTNAHTRSKVLAAFKNVHHDAKVCVRAHVFVS